MVNRKSYQTITIYTDATFPQFCPTSCTVAHCVITTCADYTMHIFGGKETHALMGCGIALMRRIP